jgi:hypothetical protein
MGDALRRKCKFAVMTSSKWGLLPHHLSGRPEDTAKCHSHGYWDSNRRLRVHEARQFKKYIGTPGTIHLHTRINILPFLNVHLPFAVWMVRYWSCSGLQQVTQRGVKPVSPCPRLSFIPSTTCDSINGWLLPFISEPLKLSPRWKGTLKCHIFIVTSPCYKCGSF